MTARNNSNVYLALSCVNTVRYILGFFCHFLLSLEPRSVIMEEKTWKCLARLVFLQCLAANTHKGQRCSGQVLFCFLLMYCISEHLFI